MIHSVGRHSIGSIRGAINYLLGDRDSKNCKRASVDVLSGDPKLMLVLSDSMTTKHRYVSLSLAFTPDECKSLTEPKLNSLIVDYIQQLAIGLPTPDRLPCIVVRHGDQDGGFHLHVLALRMDLVSGKSYQPYVKRRGDEFRFRDWCVCMIKKYQLENPFALDHRRGTSWARGLPPARRDQAEKITESLLRSIEKGVILNRTDIIYYLKSTDGITLHRINRKSISILTAGDEKPLVLRGEIYEQAFTCIGELRRTIEAKAKPDFAAARSRLEKSMRRIRVASTGKYPEADDRLGTCTDINLSGDLGVCSLVDDGSNQCIPKHPGGSGRFSKQKSNCNPVQTNPSARGGRKRPSLGRPEEVEVDFLGLLIIKAGNVYCWRICPKAWAVIDKGNVHLVQGSYGSWKAAAALALKKGWESVAIQASDLHAAHLALKAHALFDLEVDKLEVGGQELSAEELNNLKSKVQKEVENERETRSRISSFGEGAPETGRADETLRGATEELIRRCASLERAIEKIDGSPRCDDELTMSP